jgi:multiple sugar transport system ATP-binding protein
MVFQNYALYPHMTVAQNMSFSLEMNGAGKAEIAQKVQRAAEILGLVPLLGRLPKELSGGQRQRVAMGRAIVRDPKVFLFDEPLSNLDAKLRVQMRTEIKALHQRLRTTMIYVTHDQVEAMTMADRIVVLHDGVVEQIGAPLDLYDRPANLFVAGFIGSPAMNILKGSLRADGFHAEGGLVLPVAQPASPPPTGTVLYGVRPEHFSLSDTGLPALVQIVEPTGSETQVVAELGGQAITVLFRERIAARPGEILRIAPLAERAHLFDAASGLRLS